MDEDKNDKKMVKARSRKEMIRLLKKVEFYPSVECLSLCHHNFKRTDKDEIIRFHKKSQKIV